ncbi:MAG: hypothetical protein CO042_00555 [Parcubacteria group bacterium CG_4_9_14_0_2_um_filter_41_8]|nr:MAG: hypothetical protein CO042_00555 [Parcubacteria group bacterium CG_4_9_14_0_2_um_filter_41_8]
MKKLYKNLVAIIIVVLLYLINRYGNELVDIKLENGTTYITAGAVFIVGLYLLNNNKKELKGNTLQIIFFVLGIGLVLYALYALLMTFVWSNFTGF